MAIMEQKLYICFIIIMTFWSQSLTGKIIWNDCNADENQDPIYVHEFVISPMPIRLPGKYNISFDAVVSKRVPELVIDVEIGFKNFSNGEWERVYPDEENDTLRVFDACRTINEMLFSRPEAVEKQIDVQIDKVFANALRYYAGCPMLAGRIVFRDETIELPVDIIPMNSLQKNHYLVKVLFNDRKSHYLGCIQFHISYGGQVLN